MLEVLPFTNDTPRPLSGAAPTAAAIGAVLMLGTVGCGPKDDKGGNASKATQLQFEGENTFLPGFMKDSGYLPADSPAQMRIVAQSSGSISGTAAASSDGTQMTPKDGSGTLSVRGGLKFEVSAKIDVSGLDKFEGALKTIEYGIEPKETSFDPFLLDGEATVDTSLPAEELAEIPIPSIPGASVVVSVEGGQIRNTFSGACAETSSAAGEYIGEVTTSGTVELAGTIKVEIPITGTKTFGPFPIDVPIPEITSNLDLGTLSLSDGSAMEQTEVCGTGNGGGDTGMMDAGMPPGDAGPGGDSGFTDSGMPSDTDPSSRDAGMQDSGQLNDTDGPADTGTPPGDTGTPPGDTSQPPGDTSQPPEDTSDPPEDTGDAGDTGGPIDADAGCTTNNDCANGEVCSSGKCVAKTNCTTNNDCAPGEVCSNGQCI